MIDEKQAINRIGFRMIRCVAAIIAVFSWLIISTNNTEFIYAEIVLLFGNIIGHRIYMYVVARSYYDD